MKKCPECGSRLREGSAFCVNCGAKRLPTNLFCPECGAKYDASENLGEWNISDEMDGWGDTIKKFSEAEERDKLKNFQYKKTPDGKIVIEKLIDEYALAVQIPQGVSVIGDGAFCEGGILEVVLPEGLTTIGKRAFANCKRLTKINIPKSVIFIDDEAFLNCESIELQIPSTVKYIGNCRKNDTCFDQTLHPHMPGHCPHFPPEG